MKLVQSTSLLLLAAAACFQAAVTRVNAGYVPCTSSSAVCQSNSCPENGYGEKLCNGGNCNGFPVCAFFPGCTGGTGTKCLGTVTYQGQTRYCIDNLTGEKDVRICTASPTPPQPPTPACTSGVCCNMFTGRVHPSTKMCRPPCGDCDMPEYCDGQTSTCKPDSVMPSGKVCRPAVGECDQEERCPGGDGPNRFYCPPDGVKNSSTTCRAAVSNECENEVKCDGQSTKCPARSYKSPGLLCRGVTNEPCNPPEYCTGENPFCPPDIKSDKCPCAAVVPSPEQTCAVAVCEGGACILKPKPRGTLCAAADISKCILDTYCDGIGVGCPDRRRVPQGTVCRPSQGVCDVAEICPASGDCPVDATVLRSAEVVCRAATGDCDETEYCEHNTGTLTASPHCPSDRKKSSTTICRPSISECDAEERCNGKTAVCPPDVYVGAGTTCTIPGLAYPENDCDAQDTCSGSSPFCVDNRYQCYQSQGPPAFAAVLVEADGPQLFHPIAIVPGPADDVAEDASAVMSSGGRFRIERRG